MDEKERELFYFGSYITTNLELVDNTNINVKFNKIYSTVNIAVPSITFNNTISANSIVLGEITNISNLPDKDFTKDIIVNNNPSVIKIKKSNFFGKLSLELIMYSGANWGTGNLVIQPFTLTYNSTTTTNLDSNYVIPYCNDSNFTWNQIGSDIDMEVAYSNFGTSVSTSSDGSVIAVGANLYTGFNTSEGVIRVYKWNGSSWKQRGYEIRGEVFGGQESLSVSLNNDGTIFATGAHNINSGRVRVFQWDGTLWNQLGSDINGDEVGDYFGWSVSLSNDGTILAASAKLDDSNGNTANDVGRVKVYQWNGTAWIQLGQNIIGESANDEFGVSVNLNDNGTVLAIGANLNDGNGGDSGHVRVFQWDGSSWNQLGVDIDGEGAGDYFGWSVSLNNEGTVVAIGAINNDGVNGTNSGHVRVYEWNGTAWVQRGTDIDGEAANNNFGYSVSLNSSGNILAIGANLNDGNGTDSGHVRVYQWDNTAWVQLGLDIDAEATGDESGISVSLNNNGTVIAIGARYNSGGNTYAGHVRVYSVVSSC